MQQQHCWCVQQQAAPSDPPWQQQQALPTLQPSNPHTPFSPDRMSRYAQTSPTRRRHIPPAAALSSAWLRSTTTNGGGLDVGGGCVGRGERHTTDPAPAVAATRPEGCTQSLHSATAFCGSLSPSRSQRQGTSPAKLDDERRGGAGGGSTPTTAAALDSVAAAASGAMTCCDPRCTGPPSQIDAHTLIFDIVQR